MTDRLKGCVVAFDRDIREDDVEPLLAAIRMIKGVVGVTGLLADSGDYMARMRVRVDLAKKLSEVFNEILNSG